MSKAKGCFIATGIGCLVIIVIMSVFGFFAYKLGKKMYDGFMSQITQFEEQGYKRVDGQVITVSEVVTEPTVYVGQSARIEKGSERGLAIFCQTASIEGKVNGNVYFMGQILTIEPNSEITGNLNVAAQQVNIFGKLQGELQGTYQVLNRDDEESEPAAEPLNPKN